MAKPTRTAEQLRDLVAARVRASEVFQEDLAGNPDLTLELNLPLKHEHDGVSNWSIDFAPRGYVEQVAKAVDSVRLEYDME
jgi:hypothetical protein